MALRRSRIIWLIFPPLLILVLLSIGVAGWLSSREMYDFHVTFTRQHLLAQCRIVEERLQGKWSLAFVPEVDAYCKLIGMTTSTRLTIILSDGTVIGDSDHDPSGMEKHFSRPEISEARETGVGSSMRYSTTLGYRLLYVTSPVKDPSGNILGYVRSAVSIESLDAEAGELYKRIVYAALIVALLAVMVAFLLARRFKEPLDTLREGAARFAAGDLSFRIPEEGYEETDTLAETLNLMATRLKENIRTLESQRNETEAVLASMVEGVLAFDNEEHLINANSAACSLLGLSPEAAIGRNIQEVIRNSELQRFVQEALSSDDITVGELILKGSPERCLRVSGSVLRDSNRARMGCLVVLDDVSRIKHLENVRKDFVANVSHELKTPVTSIKGFCETLLEGAVDEPQNARKFVEIVARQADRLNDIIDDLLSLSRIERLSERGGVILEMSRILPIVETAIQTCELKAAKKGIKIKLSCHETEIAAEVNPHLVEQSVVNLLDNAIKYSEAGKKVEIEILRDGDKLCISVEDHGIGIPSEHLNRIFERFYTVDKARSRKLGGTGLGLAIVKHIAILHGGAVDVESEAGAGSRFTVSFPMTNPKTAIEAQAPPLTNS